MTIAQSNAQEAGRIEKLVKDAFGPKRAARSFVPVAFLEQKNFSITALVRDCSILEETVNGHLTLLYDNNRPKKECVGFRIERVDILRPSCSFVGGKNELNAVIQELLKAVPELRPTINNTLNPLVRQIDRFYI